MAAQTKFDYTVERNICSFLKSVGGNSTLGAIRQHFVNEDPIVIDHMIKLLKKKKYITTEFDVVYLDWFLLEKILL